MYNLPDHVTRYNHRNPNRWLIQTGTVRRASGWDVWSRAAVALCVPALIVAAVVILQGVAI
jgi:hypothetical protein